MPSSDHTATHAEPDELPDDSPSSAIIYLVVGIGLAMCLLALLFARGEFSLLTVALALLTTMPFLLYARLAITRPGAEAVVAGVLLIAVGCWGSVSALDSDATSDFVQLPLALVIVELAVFVTGAALRRIVPARE
ncbi:MAG: hypothetical protein JWL76_1480 [Thermoleophilia bacterium]|nr:hypothetical protein [Thermoleophilia bacterium]